MGEGTDKTETRERRPQPSPNRARVGALEADYAPAPGLRSNDRRRVPSVRPAIAAGIRAFGGWLSARIAEEAAHGHLFIWVPVFLGLGAAFALGRPHDIAWPAALAPFVGLVALERLAVHRAPAFRGVVLLAAAFAAGMACQSVEAMRTHTVLIDGDVVTRLTGTVEARERDDKGKWRYTIRVTHTERPEIRRPPDRVRLLARSRHEPLPLGATITGLARLSPPSGPALPGGYDFAFNSYYADIGAIGFFFGPPKRLAGATTATPAHGAGLARLREAISERIRAALPGPAGALAAALAVADRGGLPNATVDALRNAGLAHILAISGLHMALVAGTFFYALRALLSLIPTVAQTWPIKKIAAFGALVVATGYLALSGASVSTQRAWIMLAIVMIAIILDRPAITLRNVALAAIVVIVLSPSAVVGPSFQMSFAATAALVAAYGFLSRRRRGATGRLALLTRPIPRFVGLTIFTALVAGTATDIFSAYHFHRLTTLGALGNLLAMPLIEFIVMPMGLVAVLAMPYGLEHWPLEVMGLAIQGVIAIAYRVSALGGIVETGQVAPLAAFMLGGGLIVLTLMRSSLRLCGVGLLVTGMAMAMTAQPRPDILISEDGRLIALDGPAGLAPDASRPASFVFDQWRSAFAMPPVVKPVIIGRSSRDAKRRATDPPPPPIRPDERAALAEALATGAPGRFTCLTRAWCVATQKRIRIATIADPAYLGAACDLADIVVTRAPVAMHACRSGARLFTPAILRQTGAVEIRLVDPPDSTAGIPSNTQAVAHGPSVRHRVASADGDGGSGSRDGARNGRSATFAITTALGGVLRPWTLHRYYNWRHQRFDFADATGADPQSGLSDSGE